MHFILGINDNEYKNIGVEIKASSKEVLNSSDLITKLIVHQKMKLVF